MRKKTTAPPKRSYKGGRVEKTPAAEPRKQTRQTSTKGGLNRIGALWLGEGRNGKFMSGRIELTEGQEVRILVFKNGYKEENKHPDYIIYEPENEQEKDNRRTAAKGFGATDYDIPF